jgi:hypothetical protein
MIRFKVRKDQRRSDDRVSEPNKKVMRMERYFAVLVVLFALHVDPISAKRFCRTFTVPTGDTPTCADVSKRFMGSDLWVKELRWVNSPAASANDGTCTSEGCDCPKNQVLKAGDRVYMCGVCFPHTVTTSVRTCAGIASQYLLSEANVKLYDGVSPCVDAALSVGYSAVVCDLSMDQNVLGYVGSYPWGYPAPALSDVPYACNILALSFINAVNGDGKYVAAWDPSLSKSAIAANKLVIPDRKFIMTIGGWMSPWPDSCGSTANKERFILNSVTTLVSALESYGLDGIDINYERGPGVATWDNAARKGDWIYCMRKMIEGLKAKKPDMFISMSPFGTTTATYPHYLELLRQPLDSKPSANILSLINQVNWQIYGGNPTATSTYIDKTNGYGRMINDGIPAAKLSMGVEVDQRGLDYHPAFDAYDACKTALGIRNAFLWSTEQSSPSQPAFCHETNFAYRMGIAPKPFTLCGFPSRLIPSFTASRPEVLVGLLYSFQYYIFYLITFLHIQCFMLVEVLH